MKTVGYLAILALFVSAWPMRSECSAAAPGRVSPEGVRPTNESVVPAPPDEPPPPPGEGRRQVGPGPRGPRPDLGEPDKPRAKNPEQAAQRMAQPLNPDEEQRALEAIRRNRPWAAERLERMKADSPKAYNLLLRRTLAADRVAERLKDNDPEAYQQRMQEFDFERQEHELSQRYMATKNEKEKKEIEGQLKEILSKHFDLRSENHKREIKRAEGELDRLRDQLAAREKNREDIIKNMKLRLLGQGESLEF